MSGELEEIKAAFFVECDELLESFFDALQDLTNASGDIETINTAFRSVHSIKGSAGAFGLEDLVRASHALEALLDALRSKQIVISEELLVVLLRGGDFLSDVVRNSRSGQETGETDIRGFEVELASAIDANTANAPPSSPADPNAFKADEETAHRALQILFRPDQELYSSGNEPLYFLRNLADLGPCDAVINFDPVAEFNELASHTGMSWEVTLWTSNTRSEVEEVFEFVDGLCDFSITETSTIGETDSPSTNESTPNNDESTNALATPERIDRPATGNLNETKSVSTVRVDLGRIDRLVNLVGELVINQSMLAQSLEETGVSVNAPVSKGLDDFLQLTRDIQDSVMLIRAQPVKSLFQRMSRIVREVSTQVGKDVHLTTDGDNTEIDKTVIERLSDPLTHMVRNAIDHGLEAPDLRHAAGKPKKGHLHLSAAHRSGRVIIEISDDGAGLDHTRIRSRAIEKGLIAPEENLTEAELGQLLFRPGFSTATAVTEISGRGVGMDVVKQAIDELGGRISVSTEKGMGTKFSISLPLTLAVLDGMAVRVADETMVIPLNAISETITLKSEQMQLLDDKTYVLTVRGTFMPIYDVGVEFGYRSYSDEFNGKVALIISQEDEKYAALIVDKIEDQRQVVIKGLQHQFCRFPGVAAATILGNGRVALILDAGDLIAEASRRAAKGAQTFREAS